MISDDLITLWRACNLTWFSPCLTGPVDYLFASRHKGPRFKSPGGYLCETGILLLAMSRYIGDPDVIDHHCGLVWGGAHPEPSLGLRADNVIIPLDLTQLSCPGFTLAAGLPSGFITDKVGCWGGAPVESLQSHSILTMSHWSSGIPVCFPSQGTQVQIPRGILVWNWDSPVSDVSLLHLILFCTFRKIRYLKKNIAELKMAATYFCSGGYKLKCHCTVHTSV
jgi:hypothetical protein